MQERGREGGWREGGRETLDHLRKFKRFSKVACMSGRPRSSKEKELSRGTLLHRGHVGDNSQVRR